MSPLTRYLAPPTKQHEDTGAKCLEHPAIGVLVLLSHTTTAPSERPKQSLSKPKTSDFATAVTFDDMIQRPTSFRSDSSIFARFFVCLSASSTPSSASFPASSLSANDGSLYCFHTLDRHLHTIIVAAMLATLLCPSVARAPEGPGMKITLGRYLLLTPASAPGEVSSSTTSGGGGAPLPFFALLPVDKALASSSTSTLTFAPGSGGGAILNVGRPSSVIVGFPSSWSSFAFSSASLSEDSSSSSRSSF
mmetsp:Transcript_17632/g.36583  ORF Transcript_17632/g.36583 Transcript_17632/m.36583 type:complete len:249 (-) Transcript_17632:1433-2179(-)